MASDAQLDVDHHSDFLLVDLHLDRSYFDSTRAYIYYTYWSRFLARESLVKDLYVSENASDEDILQHRKDTGRSVDGVILNPQAKTAHCPGANLSLFKPTMYVWLSRNGLEEVSCVKLLQIRAVYNGSTLLFTASSTFPEDAAQGTWRLDCISDSSHTPKLLHHLQYISVLSTCPFHSLLINDLLQDTRTYKRDLTFPILNIDRTVYHESAVKHGLNYRQSAALEQVFTHRFSLIQGPPGTGKDRLTRAIASEYAKLGGVSLLCAVTDKAVDHLALSVNTCMPVNMARVVDPDYERTLLQEASIDPKLRQILYPEMVRRHLEQLDFDRHADSYDSILDNIGQDVLNEMSIRTFAATCSVVGCAPLWTQQAFSLVLLANAAQALEPEVIQVLNTASHQTCAHLIGDHKQLASTVAHPKNISPNYNKSLFQRMLTSGYVPFVILEDQYRVHWAIAAYPAIQFYSGRLLPANVETPVLPGGFSWPSSEPVAFVNVSGTLPLERQCSSRRRVTYYNPAEARSVIDIVSAMQSSDGCKDRSFAILASTGRQVVEIKEHLKSKRWYNLRAVGTIDKAQGYTYDIVIVSLVRSNTTGDLGSVADPRRLNVALSCAIQAVILIGDFATLTMKDPLNTWQPFFEFCSQRRWLTGEAYDAACKLDMHEHDDVSASESRNPYLTGGSETPFSYTFDEHDIEGFVENLTFYSERLVECQAFSLLLDFVLAMPEYVASSDRLEDQTPMNTRALWSKHCAFHRLILEPDPAPYVYFFCLAELVKHGLYRPELAAYLMNLHCEDSTMLVRMGPSQYDAMLASVDLIFRSVVAIASHETPNAENLRKSIHVSTADGHFIAAALGSLAENAHLLLLTCGLAEHEVIDVLGLSPKIAHPNWSDDTEDVTFPESDETVVDDRQHCLGGADDLSNSSSLLPGLVLPVVPMPQRLPPILRDTRFHYRRREQFFICDWCESRIEFYSQSYPHNGDWALPKDKSIKFVEYRTRWEAGEDFRWYCIWCLAKSEGYKWWDKQSLWLLKESRGMLDRGRRRKNRTTNVSQRPWKSCMSKRPRSPEGPPSELPADPLQVPNCMKEAEAHFPEELEAKDNLMAVEGCDQELSSASASSEFPSTLSTTAVEVCKEELSSASASNVLPSATSTTSVCAPLHGSRWYPRLQRHFLKKVGSASWVVQAG